MSSLLDTLKQDKGRLVRYENEIDFLNYSINRDGKRFFREMVNNNTYEKYLTKDFGYHYQDKEKLLNAIENKFECKACLDSERKYLLLGMSYDDGFYTILKYKL